MKKHFITLLLLLCCCFVYAQLEMRINPYIKGTIVMQNDSIKDGFIKLADSAFRVRFKSDENQKEKEKIDYKKIKKIILSKDSPNQREFYYKKTDANKYQKFVELLYRSKYDIYVNSNNDLSLFYKDVDRSNIRDFLSFGTDFINQPYRTNSEIKKYLMQVKNPKYLLKINGSDELKFIYSNRKLRKYAEKFFKGCEELIKKIKDKEYKIDDIIEIIDFYNSCNNINTERN